MDIKQAEAQVLSLLDFLRDIDEKKPKLYRKSKDRLRDVSANCLQVIQVISSILQDEALIADADDSEFSSASKSEIFEMIDSVDEELKKMKQFVGYSENTDASLSTEVRVNALKTFESTLKKTASSSIPYESARECADIIWKWYDNRFIKSVKLNPGFRYNIRKIRTWITSTVLFYGDAHERGDVKAVDKLYTWIESLNSVDSDRYAVPYDIYNLAKDYQTTKVTLSSLVIWDVLRDYGYSSLFSYGGELMPTEDELYNLCVDNSPGVLDNYRNYQFDPTIIRDCML